MEPTRFDDLTKALATATSRRQALKTIAATTIAGLLGLSGIGTAFAQPKCHRNGLGCDTNSQCCSGYCANGEKCTCPPAPACNDICPCPSGQTCCNGTCSDCPCGQVKLCNGSCAQPCTFHCDASCGGCSADISLVQYCFNFGSQGPTCTSNCDCPAGKFCDHLGNCAFLCTT